MEQENPEGYFPISGYLGIIDVVLGTHVFGSFLAYLAFNKYILEPPYYREIYRLSGDQCIWVVWVCPIGWGKASPRGIILANFLLEFLMVTEFFDSDTAKYKLGCMLIVKNQSNLMAAFCEASILVPYKRICSKLSINL